MSDRFFAQQKPVPYKGSRSQGDTLAFRWYDPDKEVLADLKTADAGFLEADLAFAAGADLVTVLGTAGNIGRLAANAVNQRQGLRRRRVPTEC